jgi:hypothetical protein
MFRSVCGFQKQSENNFRIIIKATFKQEWILAWVCVNVRGRWVDVETEW